MKLEVFKERQNTTINFVITTHIPKGEELPPPTGAKQRTMTRKRDFLTENKTQIYNIMESTSKISKSEADMVFALYNANGQGNNKRWGCQLRKDGKDVKPGDVVFNPEELMKIGRVLQLYGERICQIAQRAIGDAEARNSTWCNPRINYIVKGKLLPSKGHDGLYATFDGELVRFRKVDYDGIRIKRSKNKTNE